MAHETELKLPALIVGKPDMFRLRRELESLEEYLHQAALRKENPADLKMPKTSRLLDEFAKVNDLDLMHRADHDRAQKGIEQLLAHAPQLHFSFSVEPSSAFLAKLVGWVRDNIHPAALVQVGLQPNIAAGCIIRTPNKQFDLSLRESFERQRGLLAQLLHGGTAS